jgi:hypothetical protein
MLASEQGRVRARKIMKASASIASAIWAAIVVAVSGTTASAQNYKEPQSLNVQTVAGYYGYSTDLLSRPHIVETQTNSGTVTLDPSDYSPQTITITPVANVFVSPFANTTAPTFEPLLINNEVMSAVWGYWHGQKQSPGSLFKFNEYLFFAAGSPLNYSPPPNESHLVDYCGAYEFSYSYTAVGGEIKINPPTNGTVVLKLRINAQIGIFSSVLLDHFALSTPFGIGKNGLVLAKTEPTSVGNGPKEQFAGLSQVTVDTFDQNGTSVPTYKQNALKGKATITFFGPNWSNVVGTFSGTFRKPPPAPGTESPTGTFAGSFGAQPCPNG